jgi:hypothetical protein
MVACYKKKVHSSYHKIVPLCDWNETDGLKCCTTFYFILHLSSSSSSSSFLLLLLLLLLLLHDVENLVTGGMKSVLWGMGLYCSVWVTVVCAGQNIIHVHVLQWLIDQCSVWLVCAGQNSILKWLIDQHCDLNKSDMYGVTPLQAAVLGSNLEGVQMLVQGRIC